MKFIYGFVIFIMFASNYAYSCSCAFPDENMERSDSDADYVFIAKPSRKNVFLSISKSRFKFEEFTFFKGEPNEKIKIWSEKMFFGCGQFFSKNEKYVVFAFEHQGKLYTDRCSSWVVSDYKKSTETVVNFYKNKSKQF